MKRHWKGLVSVAALAFGLSMGAAAEAPEGYVKVRDNLGNEMYFPEDMADDEIRDIMYRRFVDGEDLDPAATKDQKQAPEPEPQQQATLIRMECGAPEGHAYAADEGIYEGHADATGWRTEGIPGGRSIVQLDVETGEIQYRWRDLDGNWHSAADEGAKPTLIALDSDDLSWQIFTSFAGDSVIEICTFAEVLGPNPKAICTTSKHNPLLTSARVFVSDCEATVVPKGPVSGTTPRSTDPVPDDQVFVLQHGLQELGYYSGAVDGLLGPQTRKAIESFQREFDLEVTGEVTPDLIYMVGFGGGARAVSDLGD